MIRPIKFLLLLISSTSILMGQTISDFENIPLSSESYIDGSDLSTTEHVSGGAVFPTVYDTQWNYWASGFAVSNVTDNTTAGYTNVYGNITGSGVNSSENFAIVSPSTPLALDDAHKGKKVIGAYVTNTTYAYMSMRDGDSFAKAFGGASGDDPDWFLLEITGSLAGQPVEDTVKFYLADYRFDDNSLDYKLDEWTWVDLYTLGNVDTLRFQLSSSDNSGGYMNTPAYFALDDLTINDIQPKAVVASDDAQIKAWAGAASIERGALDIANDPSPVSYGEVGNVIGSQNGNLVSLGDGGSVLVTFNGVVQNLPGDDIFVFENSFVAGGNMFAELAFVEVSTDGEKFVRFPAKSLTPTIKQVDSYDPIDTSLVYNLAGTAPAGYGVAFDLEDLVDSSGIDLMRIKYVKIVDVAGTIDENYASYDAFGHIVNDPYPTAFVSGGFDLDAVGVSNLNAFGVGLDREEVANFSLYPNPSAGPVHVQLNEYADVSVLDLNGVTVFETTASGTVTLNELPSGMYFVKCQSASGTFTEKLVVR